MNAHNPPANDPSPTRGWMPEETGSPSQPEVTPLGSVDSDELPIDLEETRVAGDEFADAASKTASDSQARYQPVRLHAQGGLGEVLLARDVELNREVALKRIRSRHAGNPGSRQRFLMEAEITAQLEHPGVVPVHGLVQGSDGQPSYAMRFIQGESLQAALERFHKLQDPPERNMQFRQFLGRFLAVCNTIAYAHSKGIIHRDLKPANIMLGEYGETLVVDWGLAKRIHDQTNEPPVDQATAEESPGYPVARSPAYASTDAGLTQDGEAMGTPAFMSPEQAEGQWEQVGPASDIYGLGATLYAILTGHAPFRGRKVDEVLERVRHGDFPLPAK